MKKKTVVVLALLFVMIFVVACGGDSSNPPANDNQGAQSGGSGKYTDGAYYAEQADYSEKSGWKEAVALKVENGNIVDVYWTALHKDGGLDKKLAAKKGKYGMINAGAQSEWDVQAEIMEQLLIEKQDPEAIVVNEDGKTDAVSGVSITVDGFVELAEAALAAGPVEVGPYKDGHYYAEGDFAEKSDWKETVDVTILNGNIYALQWNGLHKDGGTDKVTRSKDGEYGMKAGGAQAEWHEQTVLAEQFILEKQDPNALSYDDGGYTDAVSGVSIHVNGFIELLKEALKQAK